MICPKCSGGWTTKRRRNVCSECGYMDQRMSWCDGVYTGPTEENPDRLSSGEYFALREVYDRKKKIDDPEFSLRRPTKIGWIDRLLALLE